MKNQAEEKVLALSEPIASELGVYVVDVEKKKEGKTTYLRIFIDKEGGVGLDDCEAFSRTIDPILDEVDPIAEAYNLEVSSPGVDRKLETSREFLYYIGRRVSVKLYKAVSGVKEFDGELISYDGGIVTIRNDEGENISFKKEEAVYIRLYFKM